MNEIALLPSSVTTLYTELLQQVMTFEADRTIADLKGTFVSKRIREKSYWYLQFNEAGKQRQVYLGAENKELLAVIERHESEKNLKQADVGNRRRLCQMLRQGGVVIVDATSSRIINLLSQSGVFRMGGVLVGTHAFVLYAAMLGVKWPSSLRTQDIDVAQDKNISVALSAEDVKTDLSDVLARAEMGFHPVPALNHKHPSTTFKIRGQETHVDILTPLKGKENGRPIFLPSLNVAAEPLRFLDYLIERTEDAVMVHEEGVLVRVPHPARFALHKLLVSRKRGVAFHAKQKKDEEQALLLLEVLLRDRQEDIVEAWADLKKRGSGWTKPVRDALQGLKKREPALVVDFFSVVS